MDFRRDSTKQPSLRFQTLSKMCLLKWIHLNFSFLLKKQLLDFFLQVKLFISPYFILGKCSALAEIL